MGKRIEYVQRHDGEWFEISGREHIVKCCDCGLVHRLKFRLFKGKIRIAAWRDNPKTAAVRKREKYDS